jgi:hypothetical protein
VSQVMSRVPYPVPPLPPEPDLPGAPLAAGHSRVDAHLGIHILIPSPQPTTGHSKPAASEERASCRAMRTRSSLRTSVPLTPSIHGDLGGRRVLTEISAPELGQ